MSDMVEDLEEIWTTKQHTNNGPFVQKFEATLCDYTAYRSLEGGWCPWQRPRSTSKNESQGVPEKRSPWPWGIPSICCVRICEFLFQKPAL